MTKRVEELVLSKTQTAPRCGWRLRSALFPNRAVERTAGSPRRGVTLIELLVTIMIISILAAAVLGVAAVAGETAREAKTKAIISRIHSLLMEHYDTYTSRRVKLRPEVLDAISGMNTTTAKKGQAKAEARLYALRELILMEMPDRWSDVLLNSVGTPPASSTFRYPIYLDVSNTNSGRTELADLYRRTFLRIAASENKISESTNTTDEILDNQGAECLYMVVMNACGDGEARTLFPESSIGDTDGDGAPEFLDGWGHPIDFLRWAPGFRSDAQVNANDLDSASTPSDAWAAAAASDHDQFDLYRTDTNAFRLLPLVFSVGRDEEGGLVTMPQSVRWTGNPSVTTPFVVGSAPKLQPWQLSNYGSDTFYLGANDGTKAETDNLTNHLISTK